jgi:hypothetical protein
MGLRLVGVCDWLGFAIGWGLIEVWVCCVIGLG